MNSLSNLQKILLASSESSGLTDRETAKETPLFEQGQWPALWIHSPKPVPGPHFLLFRKTLHIEQPLRVRVHVTADERYILWLNGERVAEGPERGDPDDWYFDSYDVELEAGVHTLLARVHALGSAAPRAQMSLRPGFLLAAEGATANDLLATGVSPWDVVCLPGYAFESPFDKESFSIGFNCIHDGRSMDWDLECGQGQSWLPAEKGLPGADPAKRNRYPTTHLLNPALLPARNRQPFRGGSVRVVEAIPNANAEMRYPCPNNEPEMVASWNRLYREGKTIKLPKHTQLRVLIDMEDYIGADYAITFKGAAGASIKVALAESLFEDTDFVNKGQRNQIEGKYYKGIGDTFIASGSNDPNRFESIFWRSGRYLELSINTQDTPMQIEKLELYRVGFPIAWDYDFTSDDPSLQAIRPLVERTLAASTDDSFMDGPYYEQMLWVGDLVQTQLTHFVTHLDLPLARKAMRSFDASRMHDGLTCARWPARDRMIIAPFSLYWIELIHDYAYWRGELDSLRQHMPGVRGVIDAFLGMYNGDGLLEIHKGWNFVDWVPEWPMGIPPGADGGVSSILNWQFVRILGKYATLEALFDEPELAARAKRIAETLSTVLCAQLWDDAQGLFRDAPQAETYSEHAQALAILSDCLPDELRSRLSGFTSRPMTRATISFSHFIFEALFKMCQPMAFFERLSDWKLLPGKGFLTLPEGPEPSRSDCHAWGSHPLYHLMASVLGIRPASAGFATVEIRPQPGPLLQAKGHIPHPQGSIEVALEIVRGQARARVTLPKGLTGKLMLNNGCHSLVPGVQTFE
jgi:alpha-L-rhamnosidase